MPIYKLLLLLVALLVSAIEVGAQVGTTTEIIAGRVTGVDSQPILGARVEVVSVATGVIRRTTTRPDGRFTLLFRDGGAQFRVTVTALGMAPATLMLTRRGDEDRLVAEFRMSATATTLSSVQVRANGSRPGAAPASTAGGTEAVVPQAFLTRFPITPGDLNNIATVVPGVVAVAGGDSTPASFSVGGQPANQNNVTLDGSSFLFGSLPQNSVRAVRVITNAYDPARGQFTGGQVATTTLSGSSRLQGNASFNLQQPALQFPTIPSRSFGQRYTQNNGSIGLGGPLVKDQAFYFVSAEYDRRTDPLASLLDANGTSLSNLGLDPDSLSRFLQFAQRNGLASRAGTPSDRLTTSISTLTRLDWDVNPSNALMVRGDYRRTAQNVTRFGGLALPTVGGAQSSDGGGLMTSLTSSVGSFINEARAYVSADEQSIDGFRVSPLGVVTVASNLATGREGQAQLQFGANPSLPRRVSTRLLEVSNELSRLVGSAHRVKVGLLVNAGRSSIVGNGNQYGTYLYNSLADLDSARPALFVRSLNGTSQRAGTNSAAVYVGDAWRVSPSLQVVYGARVEGTKMPGVPALNRDVEQTFGIRTDRWPTDLRVTPRLGFTYLLGNVAGIPAGTVKGGVGLFRGTIPGGLVGAVANGTGLAGAQAQVVCTGASVPLPDWSRFGNDETQIPGACTDVGGAVAAQTAARPTILHFDDTFGAPEVWRASLGYSRQFRLRWAVAADMVYSYGLRSPSAIDRNLGASAFALDTEAGRRVFSPVGDIVPTTGAVTGNGARRIAQYGPVLAIGAGAQSRATQLTMTIAGPSFRGGGTSLSYTYNRATDMSNGFGLGAAAPTTDGDPNRMTWGTSDLERRHQIVGQQFTSFPHGLELAVIGRLIAGARYTPMVNGDANGDGARNDRAFIPRADGSGAVATQMAALLSTADSRAAACLRAQVGRIAERNSCGTPWSPQLDVQLNWQPRNRRLDDRLTISLIATNTLAGLDRALHGDALKGWGQPVFADRNLLTITGFDPATRAYRYTVNQRFGTPTGSRNPFGVPFQLSLRGQIALGTDPGRAQLKALTANNTGDSASKATIKQSVLRQVPYPFDSLLKAPDSLGIALTAAQRATIAEVAARYRTFVDARGDEIVVLLSANNGRPDMGAMAPRLQQINVSIVRELQQGMKTIEGALTPAQWAKIPDKIKYPFGQQGGG
ncbi:MAG: TonB-dependent receptor [Gemmatimonadaceae bacterium]|nr:TonB-dependent receptor [Gemmatimonadaceae bacterium]